MQRTATGAKHDTKPAKKQKKCKTTKWIQVLRPAVRLRPAFSSPPHPSATHTVPHDAVKHLAFLEQQEIISQEQATANWTSFQARVDMTVAKLDMEESMECAMVELAKLKRIRLLSQDQELALNKAIAQTVADTQDESKMEKANGILIKLRETGAWKQ